MSICRTHQPAEIAIERIVRTVVGLMTVLPKYQPKRGGDLG